MASRSEASSHEGSPSIIRPDDSDDDLEASFDLNSLITSQTSTGLPLSGDITDLPKRSQEQDSIVIPVKKEDVIKQWTSSEAECIDLSDSEQSPFLIPIKKEEPMTWKFSGGECINLLDSEQDPAGMHIKKENPDVSWNFTKLELVELSDTEDGIPGQTQLLADSSTHEDANQEETSHEEINHDHEDANHENGNRGDINHGKMNFGAMDHEDSWESAKSKMQHYQKILAERALGRPLAEGADRLFNKLQTPHVQNSDTDALDPNSWMNATIDPDADSGAAYAFDYPLNCSASDRKTGSLQPKKNSRKKLKPAQKTGLMRYIMKKLKWLRKPD